MTNQMMNEDWLALPSEATIDPATAVVGQYKGPKADDHNFRSGSIWELARKTQRYAYLERNPNCIEVFDERQILEGLLQWDAVLPFDEWTGLNDFVELRSQLSPGPILTKADQEMLVWLQTNAELLSADGDGGHYAELYSAATAFKGNEAEVRAFLLGARYQSGSGAT